MQEIFLKYRPFARQVVASQSTKKYKLYGGAVGGGKSYWLCMECIKYALMFPGNRIFMFREELSSFKITTLTTMLHFLEDSGLCTHNKSECFFKFTNGSVIYYRGFAETRTELKEKKGSLECGVFAIDEAHEVQRSNFLFLQSRLRWKLPNGKSPIYKGLLACNPAQCWLKEDFVDQNTRKFDYDFIRSLPSDNTELPDGYLDDLLRNFPEAWRKRYLEGDWDAFGEGDIIIPADMVKDCVEREITITGDISIACDVAVAEGEQADETVIYAGHGGRIIDQRIYKGKDTQITGANVTAFYKKYKAKRAIIDDIGVGHGVSDFCSNIGLNVVRFVAGAKSSNRQLYHNLKTEAWWSARKKFEAGEVCLPNDPILIRQLSAVKYETTGKYIACEKKIDTKKRLDWSPDRADALIMMLWANRFSSSIRSEYFRDLDKQDNVDFPETRPIDRYGWGNYKPSPFHELGMGGGFPQWN